MSLQADVLDGRANIYRWNVNTLAWVAWDGALQTGALTIGTVDQGAAGASAWKVDGSAVTQPISGTVTANAGTGPFPVSDNAGSLTVDAPVTTPVFIRLSDGLNPISTLPVTVSNVSLAVTQGGTFTVQPGNSTNAVAWRVILHDGTSQVVINNQGSLQVKEQRAATPTQSTVNDSATSVTLLAANANRLGATIANDSSAVLYLKLGATASATSYTARIAQFGLYEVPYGYTGIVDGIWASDPNDGAARITELAA